ncbi:MAG: DoxX family protein [Polyangiaceae bacterium]
MQAITTTVCVSKEPVSRKLDPKVLAGRGISVLVTLFMTFDGVAKVLVEPHVVKAQAELGFPAELAVPLGLVVLACTALYAFPRTAMLGAVLLTAWLGGATAAKVRLEDASLLFSVVMGVLVWAGLYLRDERLRALLPLRRRERGAERAP